MVHVQIFASDSFLELTEYTREEILGRNCRYEKLYLYFRFLIILIVHCHLPPIVGAFKLAHFFHTQCNLFPSSFDHSSSCFSL
jgi:hypothetical protein